MSRVNKQTKHLNGWRRRRVLVLNGKFDIMKFVGGTEDGLSQAVEDNIPGLPLATCSRVRSKSLDAGEPLDCVETEADSSHRGREDHSGHGHGLKAAPSEWQVSFSLFVEHSRLYSYLFVLD